MLTEVSRTTKNKQNSKSISVIQVFNKEIHVNSLKKNTDCKLDSTQEHQKRKKCVFTLVATCTAAYKTNLSQVLSIQSNSIHNKNTKNGQQKFQFT